MCKLFFRSSVLFLLDQDKQTFMQYAVMLMIEKNGLWPLALHTMYLLYDTMYLLYEK